MQGEGREIRKWKMKGRTQGPCPLAPNWEPSSLNSWLRHCLGIRFEQKITNEEVRRRVRCKKNMILKRVERKLNLFGPIICRIKDNRLVKEVMSNSVIETETVKD